MRGIGSLLAAGLLTGAVGCGGPDAAPAAGAVAGTSSPAPHAVSPPPSRGRTPACDGTPEDGLRPEYAGLALDVAEDRARAEGLRSRTVTLDGYGLTVSADYDTERVSFDVEGGAIPGAGASGPLTSRSGTVVGGVVVCARIG